jgi:hypothetical protein
MMKPAAVCCMDRAWFRKNGDANMRLRLPGPGEVERILKRILPASAYEIAMNGGVARTPDESTKWIVAVVKVDNETLLKMLVLRPKGWTKDPSEVGFTAFSAYFGQRAFIERVNG